MTFQPGRGSAEQASPGWTEGPWVPVEDDFDDCIHVTTAARVSARLIPIAAVTVGYEGPIEAGQQANIALIAAAPDLYEAAAALDASWMEDFPDGPDGNYRARLIQPGDDHLAVWRQIRAALSRARGES